MKIISYNVNGIRAAINKDLVGWIGKINPDVLCFQEIKALASQIPVELFRDLGYHCYWYSAEKKGYSGVAILCKQEPTNVVYGTGIDYMDKEGRNLRIDFPHISVMSLYTPSGTNLDRLDFKLNYMDDFFNYITELKQSHPNLLICGDYNICHQEIDIHDPIRNANVSGFLPIERSWLTKFIDSGFIDTFRHLNKEPHQYSWWSYRANARHNNKGWRIDYCMLSQSALPTLTEAFIMQDVVHSDHCPVGVKLNFKNDEL